MEKELRELIGMKDRLFSNISHDLHGPLASFMMLLYLIVDDGSDFNIEKMNVYLKEMKNVSKNTYYLLENLLSWTNS